MPTVGSVVVKHVAQVISNNILTRRQIHCGTIHCHRDILAVVYCDSNALHYSTKAKI